MCVCSYTNLFDLSMYEQVYECVCACVLAYVCACSCVKESVVYVNIVMHTCHV